MDARELPQNNLKKPVVLREYEFFGGSICIKISVKNKSGISILDATLDIDIDEKVLHFERFEPEYPEKKGKLILGNIKPNTDRTVALYLDPLICAKEGTDVNCRVDFSYANGKPDSVHMESLKISVVCPVFHTEDHINIGRLKELGDGLAFHDSKVYTIQKRIELGGLFGACRDVILLHDVRHIKTFKTVDDKTHEAWYYGKTKVTKRNLVIKCSIVQDTGSIEVFAAGENPADITGLLAEIGRNLVLKFEKLGRIQPVFNIHIKDSIIQRSNLLSFCDMDGTCGGDVVIENSVVQRSNIVSGNELKLREERQEEEILQRIAKKKNKYRTNMFMLVIVLGVLLVGFVMFAPGSDDASDVPPFSTQPEKIANTRTIEVTTSESASTATKNVEPDISTPVPYSNQKTYTNSIGMEFVLIPAGSFDWGSPSDEKDRDNDEGPVHYVKIQDGFYLGKYEVTQKQWREVMGNNPSIFTGDDRPVEKVSWNDAQEFIKKLNQKEGTGKYRLPSEAEWEYAARAGTTTRYSFGDRESRVGEYAWYRNNSGSETQPVGQKKPNPWGLYDMHGNVWEWVQDLYHSDYKGAPTDGMAWESGEGAFRVNRGGSWGNLAWRCRSAVRSNFPPSYRLKNLGFRLLMIP